MTDNKADIAISSGVGRDRKKTRRVAGCDTTSPFLKYHVFGKPLEDPLNYCEVIRHEVFHKEDLGWAEYPHFLTFIPPLDYAGEG